VLKKPYGHPEVQGFDDRTPAVFDEAERSPGFIDRAREVSGSDLSNFERDWGKWGRFDVPRFYRYGRDSQTDQRASTLSLWADLAAVYGFTYGGLHVAALRRRTEWFLTPEWPTYAIWWVADDHTPRWDEACRKLEMLHDRGSSPDSFDFKSCFDASGAPIEIRALQAVRRDRGSSDAVSGPR
jgi:hypothetical protein